jgi:hypothetical protein
MLLLDSLGCAMLNAAVSALDIGAGGAKLRSSIAGGAFVLFAMCALTLLVLLAGFGYHMYKDAGIEQQAIDSVKAEAAAFETRKRILNGATALDGNLLIVPALPSAERIGSVNPMVLHALSSMSPGSDSAGSGKGLGTHRSPSTIRRTTQLGPAHTVGAVDSASAGKGGYSRRHAFAADATDERIDRGHSSSSQILKRAGASNRSIAFSALIASPSSMQSPQ